MALEAQQQPEFSRPIAPDSIGEDGVTKEIEANATERSALAARLGIPAIDRLTATIRLARVEGGALIRITGHFQAEVTQTCVVSLEPVSSRLEDDFSLLYDLTGRHQQHDAEILVDLDEADPPEPVPPGGIDLGEAVAEQVALALDPYPRAEGAALERDRWSGTDPNAPDDTSPFAVLASLKKS